jgi:prolyl oligopeptidase
MLFRAFAAIAALSLPALAAAADLPAPPATPQIPITDTYHGVSVTDPYRWLENRDDPQVKAWSAAQSARARDYFDHLAVRKPIAAELRRYITGASPAYYGLALHGGRIFASYDDPKFQQTMIVTLDEAANPASRKVVLDPNTMDPSGHTEIDWWDASPDGALIAVSLSKNGSEDGTLHVYRVATGEEVGAPIPGVQYPTAGGSLAWTAAGDGFWYTRYPGEDAPAADRHYNVQVYFHKLGDDWVKDPLALGAGDGLERISEVFLANTAARPAVIAMVQRGDGGQYAQYLLRPGAPAVKLSDYDDKIVAAIMGPDDAIYGVSQTDALNGKIVKLTGAMGPGSLARAPVLVPEGKGAIRIDGVEENVPALVVTKDRIFVREMIGGPSQVLVFNHAGRQTASIPLPAVADVDEIDPVADGGVLFGVRTYLKPRYFARWSPATKAVTATKLKQTSPISFADATVTRVFATSKDGTKIPVNVIARKGVKLDGKNPVLLYAYGGFGLSQTPHFAGSSVRLWLDGGGVYAIANIRGGAEYGERWHQEGYLLKKQNDFDDMAAAGQYLIDRRYTSHARLSMLGGSNGGLLMGAVVTQHPTLARAVVSEVGLYDMLRFETDPNGAFNTTEYGSVQDETQFKALYAYSP